MQGAATSALSVCTHAGAQTHSSGSAPLHQEQGSYATSSRPSETRPVVERRRVVKADLDTFEPVETADRQLGHTAESSPSTRGETASLQSGLLQ